MLLSIDLFVCRAKDTYVKTTDDKYTVGGIPLEAFIAMDDIFTMGWIHLKASIVVI